MSKAPSKPKHGSKPQLQTGKTRFFYSIHPWEARHHEDHSEITAYVEASGTWETVLDVLPTSGASHEAMTLFILAILREHQEKRNALRDAMEALELVMADGLTYSSEQAAEHAIATIKRVIS